VVTAAPIPISEACKVLFMIEKLKL
jgi:hypothetical protein